MLANTLSVEDEEAVQNELLELQREAVSTHLSFPWDWTGIVSSQLGEAPEKPLDLPSVPNEEPVVEREPVPEDTEVPEERQRVPIPA